MKTIITTILFFFLTANFAYADSIHAKTKKINTPQGIKLVCAKKNDKPHRSFKTEKWHLDRECCLDNREIPNKNCYYGKKYQKLILKYNLKFLK